MFFKRPATLLRINSSTGVFLRILQNFKKQLFYGKLLVETSLLWKVTVQNCIKSFWTVNFSTYGNVCSESFGTVTSETMLKKKNRPVFLNMNLIFLLAVCVNGLVVSFPVKYISC